MINQERKLQCNSHSKESVGTGESDSLVFSQQRFFIYSYKIGYKICT